jgi:diadenosine tetraphosphate (Ap4A) HIT family hydrolase
MTQTKEDLENIKSKLLEHIDKTYSPEEANDFKQKISKMNDIEFVEFLKTQGLIKGEESSENCVFCSMVANKIPTTKINENSKAIAILEINPISKGHTMVIPKPHITEIKDFPEEAKKLAEKVSQNLTNAFHPQRIEFAMTDMMGHQIMNVIPVYSNENINSERTEETPESLAKLKDQIDSSKTKTIEPPKPTQLEQIPKDTNEINEENTWLPKRMKP